MPCSAASSSCGTCLSSGGSSCGWCQSSLSCEDGDKFGPSTLSDCANWAWYYQYCPGDPEDKCPKLQTCAECVDNGRSVPFVDPTSCGWCITDSGSQRCVSGQINGPAVGARCASGGWFFSQFTTKDQCPAAAPSLTRTPSSSPSSPALTHSLSGTSSGGGAGGGNSISPITVDAVAVAASLSLLVCCLIGVIFGMWLRNRSLPHSGVKDTVTLNSAYSAYSSAYSSK